MTVDLSSVLQKLHDNYAVLFPAIDSRSVQQASVTLVKSGVSPIPLDYVSFLTQTNGLSWNGNELFSLNNIEREKGAFYHPGIMQHFGFCQNNPIMKKKLLLGFGLESLFIYDGIDKQYAVLDRYTYKTIMTFPTVLSFLQKIISAVDKTVSTSE